LIADPPKDGFIARRLHRVVIDPVIARCGEVSVIGREGVVVGRVEKEELEFARDVAD
jgi:hypothetical protein